MRILITGIAGTIGSILAPDLERDHDVYGLDLRPSERPNTIQVDLCDADALAPAFEGMEVVVHLAADPRHEPEIGWDALMNLVCLEGEALSQEETGEWLAKFRQTDRQWRRARSQE